MIRAKRHPGPAAVWVLVLAFAIVVAPGVAAQEPQEPPRFTSSVEVASVDVTVVDNKSRPIRGLGPGDFTVTVDGDRRRVVSAEWVPLATPEGRAAEPPPEGYTSNEYGGGGRLILIVVDQPNIRFGQMIGMRPAIEAFIDRLTPADRVAVVGTGPGSASTPFTSDRQRVKDALGRMAGQQEYAGSIGYRVTLSEGIAARRGDAGVVQRAVSRECAGEVPGTAGMEICTLAVTTEAERVGNRAAADAQETISALRQLLTGLRAIDAPKTILLVSEGFVVIDEPAAMVQLGALAAEARTSIYVLLIDEPVFDITEPGVPLTRFEDRFERLQGADILVGATRGSLFRIPVAADGVLALIESELSGYYLLAVESIPADKDGRSHPIRVRVNRDGAVVRARREIVAGAEVERPRGGRAAVAAALMSPLPIAALPLRAATFSLRAPDDRVQVLIHAEIGTSYPSSRTVTLGYYITDAAGAIVESQMVNGRLVPVMNGVPSALQFNSSASLPPGNYMLKLAVAEGDLVGSLEHPIHAGLVEETPFMFSELMAGGPAEAQVRLAPTVGHTISFGTLHGYLEAYGASAGALAAKFEVVRTGDGPPILDVDVPARTAGADRAIFSQVIPVRQLPPGPYVLRATIPMLDGAVKSFTRSFEVAGPPVLMSSAESSATVAATELFLPVADELFTRVFNREEAARPEIVRMFRERVVSEAAEAFDRGVAQFAAGDYKSAEVSLKSAIRTDADSTAAFTYLAAVFAAVGEDAQAAGAWQTALIEGDDFPQIYLWLADALMRAHDLAQARTILEEAIGKWPADVRFAKPLALLYATFGQGREAVRTMVRHLDVHPDDAQALALAVEWIYHLHVNGAVARTRADDVRLARSYAAAYERAGGSQAELVKEWMDVIEGRRR